MSLDSLRYVSYKVDAELRAGIHSNLARYIQGSFGDLATTSDWSLPLTLKVDLDPLRDLKIGGGSETEVHNSMLVWQVLHNLTPALASEGRLWTRLTHVEALSFARARWIGHRTGEAAEKRVATHFFAVGRTGCRDDNAVGRLWWNAYIGSQACPDQPEQALKALLSTADVRLSVIERPGVASRTKVCGAIVRAITHNPAVSASEDAFRNFMKSLNKRGGGVLFEVMEDSEIDAFLDACIVK